MTVSAISRFVTGALASHHLAPECVVTGPMLPGPNGLYICGSIHCFNAAKR
jgi:hypothetical protein